jgi:hypothetical protein
MHEPGFTESGFMFCLNCFRAFMSSQWVFDSENFSSVVVETMMSENRRKFRFFIL